MLQQMDDKTLVNLPDAILFPSGSDNLTSNGIETLSRISSVLEEYPNRAIAVEGHTDDIPIGPTIKDKYATNWAAFNLPCYQGYRLYFKIFRSINLPMTCGDMVRQTSGNSQNAAKIKTSSSNGPRS